MAGLKEIRVRIASVSTTRQITSAMKMVSAAKLKRAQDAILQMRPYAEKLKETISSVSEELEQGDEDNIYGIVRPANKVLIVLITSNKGLCGGFNSNAIKSAINMANTKYADQFAKGNVKFLPIGRKGNDYLNSKKYSVAGNYSKIFEKLTFENVQPVAEELMKLFVKGEYDVIEVVYNQFKNAAVQILTNEQFLPIVAEKQDMKKKTRINFIYEPTREVIIQELIPKVIKMQLFKALLDSNASEQGARMTAMHKATDNATEMIRSLTLVYNKERQATITKQILEVVSGSEAQKG
jgi:F-type H+-transporting ATPase subunit gamma